MPRLVVPRSIASGRLVVHSDVREMPPDDYLDRLTKYVPAESISVYLLVDRTLTGAFGSAGGATPATVPADGPQSNIAGWLIFLLVLALTPVYLRSRRMVGQPWKLNALIGTLAFVCWAYAIGGTAFVSAGIYNAVVAGLVAPLFTFIAGAFQPRPMPAAQG